MFEKLMLQIQNQKKHHVSTLGSLVPLMDFRSKKNPQNINFLEDHPNTFLPSLVLVVQMVSEKKIKMSKFTDEMRRRTQSDDNSSLDLNVT